MRRYILSVRLECVDEKTGEKLKGHGGRLVERRSFLVSDSPAGAWDTGRLMALLPSIEAALLGVCSKTAWGPVPLRRL